MRHQLSEYKKAMEADMHASFAKLQAQKLKEVAINVENEKFRLKEKQREENEKEVAKQVQ